VNKNGNKKWRNAGLYALLAIVAIALMTMVLEGPSQPKETWMYSEFIQNVEQDRVDTVRISADKTKAIATAADGSQVEVNLPNDEDLIDILTANDVDIVIDQSGDDGFLLRALSGLIVPLLVIVGLFFLLRRAQGGPGSQAMNFGKSRAKVQMEPQTNVTFADVAGIEQAKLELSELVDFLKNADRFTEVGAKIPKGALLVGPPGTGKTLLARAVAGEAGVPFFSISGSEFVEMFVGVGASRVRDLFEQAKSNAPCIIFIDEIDAVGRHRGAGLGGGHDEREQTLNQLLVEMDGFDTNEGVILIAATNRPDVLDPALLRPGRFDRQIVVDMPDLRGREGILKVHLRKIQAGPDVDVRDLARGTPGMSGADLANVVNEGALLAARRNHEQVTMEDLEDAKEKVMMGPERRSKVIPQEERRVTAYHESGHAIVAASLEDYDPVHKVTIIPRGMAGGLTMTLPDEERTLNTRKWFVQRITTAMGGRAAEELVFPEITAGAYSDIQHATQLARNMVMRFGMSDRLGPVAFGHGNEPVFLGKDLHHQRDYSEQTAIAIDEEVHRFLSESYNHAMQILKDNRDKLDLMAETLLERETLDRAEVMMIMKGEPLPEMPQEPAPTGHPEPEDDGTEAEEKQTDSSPGPILGGDAPPSTAG